MVKDDTLFRMADANTTAQVMVIAELGVNHDGDIAKAIDLVAAAADAGADAVKVQWFHPDRLLSNEAALALYQENQAGDLHELLSQLTLTLDQLKQLAAAARQVGVRFIATLFSPDDAADLAQLDLDAVKIASPDAVNPPLLQAAAGLDLPMLVSTGTCDAAELEPVAALLQVHRAGGCLLQCVSAYPVPDELAALGGIAVLHQRFGLPAGYSDHTASEIVGGLAVAAGAVVLEKHLTYDSSAAGPDHSASLEPAGLKRYIDSVRQAAAMLGPRQKVQLDIEADVKRVSRQSVCLTRDLPAGHVLQREDLTVKRPGTGLPAAQFNAVIGKQLTRAVAANQLLQAADLDGYAEDDAVLATAARAGR